MMSRFILITTTIITTLTANTLKKPEEISRKILGSSVVTSVSVIMNSDNGSTIYSDTDGKPLSKPESSIGSPVDFLNPDRYEFYTFDNSGDLVKRLMTLDEIHGIVATGDGDGHNSDTVSSDNYLPEKKVIDIVQNVQNVLKDQIEKHKENDSEKLPLFDTPDVSDTWSMILPTVFGNTGEKIEHEKPTKPETIPLEPKSTTAISIQHIETNIKQPSSLDTNFTSDSSTTVANLNITHPLLSLLHTTTRTIPTLKVEILSNSYSSTEKYDSLNDIVVDSAPIIEIKPVSKSPIKYSTPNPVVPSAIDKVSVNSTMSNSIELINNTEKPLIVTSTRESTTDNIITTDSLFTITNDITSSSMQYFPQTINYDSSSTPLEFNTEEKVSSSTDMYQIQADCLQLKDALKVSKCRETAVDKNSENITPNEFVTVTNSYSTPSNVDDSKLTSTTVLFDIISSNPTIKQSFLDKSTEYNVLPESTPFSTVKYDSTTIYTTEKSDHSTLKSNNNIEGFLSTLIPNESSTLKVDKVVSTMENNENVASTTIVMYNTIMHEKPHESTTIQDKVDDIFIFQDEIESTSNKYYKPTIFTESTNVPTQSTTILYNNDAIETHTTNIPEITTQQTETNKFTLSNFISSNKISSTLFKTNEVVKEPSHFKEQITKSNDSKISHYDFKKVEITSPFTVSYPTTTEEQHSQAILNQTEIPTTESDTPTVLIKDEVTTINSFMNKYNENVETFSTVHKESSITIIANETKFQATRNSLPKDQIASDTKSTWTLVSTVDPHPESFKDNESVLTNSSPPPNKDVEEFQEVNIDLAPKPFEGFGLDGTTSILDQNIFQFVQLCNELGFSFWKTATRDLNSAKSIMLSPFGAISLLAMVFLGARGSTSGEMNEILKLDDMATFNPHLVFKNVSQSIQTNPKSGVAVFAVIRELFSDRSKAKLLRFYKERAKQFYNGYAEEVGFRGVGDTLRNATNNLIKIHTKDKIENYLEESNLALRPPLAGISVNIFQTDCSQATSKDRDGEIQFAMFPSLRQKRIVTIPAVVFKSGFLAGYESSLDATSIALGTSNAAVSIIFVLPGQQMFSSTRDGLFSLEKRLIESSFRKGAWSRLLRSLIPRPELELQIPKFSIRSFVNVTSSLKRLGLKNLFDSRKADLRGLNGVAHELHLSDMVQINDFATCGENGIDQGHYSEAYPNAGIVYRDNGDMGNQNRFNLKASQRATNKRMENSMNSTKSILRLRLDRPFLFFVRHNPTGLILHMGRFHPK